MADRALATISPHIACQPLRLRLNKTKTVEYPLDFWDDQTLNPKPCTQGKKMPSAQHLYLEISHRSQDLRTVLFRDLRLYLKAIFWDPYNKDLLFRVLY